MKFNNKITFIISFLALIGLAGCAHYKARPLNRLTPVIPPNVQEQFISFSYHIFSQADCLKYLDRDVISKGYQPVHIAVTNHSCRSFYMPLGNFSFQCASALEVAQKVHTSTAKRVVGYGVLGLFLWPFLIPAVIDGVGSTEANQYLDIDFVKKSLEDQSISPFSTINGLIFVPKEQFNQNFSFALIDQENHDRFMLTPSRPRVKIKTLSLDYIKHR